MINTTLPQILIIFATSIIGMLGISAAVTGYLVTKVNLMERLLFFTGGLLMIDPHTVTDTIGLAILISTYVMQKIKAKKAKLKTQ